MSSSSIWDWYVTISTFLYIGPHSVTKPHEQNVYAIGQGTYSRHYIVDFKSQNGLLALWLYVLIFEDCH